MSADPVRTPETSELSGPSGRNEPTVGELVARASRDLGLLIHAEIELAKTELSATARVAGLGAGLLAATAFLSAVALLFALVGVALLVHATGLALSWSFLVVAGGLLLLGGGLGALGARRLRRASAPERTLRTLKGDLAWARHPTAAPDG
ncbi:MAG: phage holin family protein [Mycobacteriales bacterium]